MIWKKGIFDTDFRIPGWKVEKKEERKNEWHIAFVCTLNKICAGENTSRDTSKEPQEPHFLNGFTALHPALPYLMTQGQNPKHD